jgi:hypothetical protein
VSPETPPNRDQRSPLRWSNIFGVALFAIVCSLAVYGTYSLKNVPGSNQPLSDSGQTGLRAFHNQVYYPVRALVTGENPYSPAYLRHHPDSDLGKQIAMDPITPSTLLILSPLAFLQLHAAEIAYILICVLLAIASANLLLKSAIDRPPSIGATMLTAALMIACLPGVEAFVAFPTVMITLFGVLLAIEHSGRQDLLSGIGIVLAFFQPVIGVAILILILFRRHFGAVAFGILLLVILNVVAIAWIGNNTEGGVTQAMDDARGLYTSVYKPVIQENLHTSSDRVDAYSVVARIFSSAPWVAQQTNLHCYIATGILLLAVIALLSERDPTQMKGAISRSGMLIATVPILFFYQTTGALYLLWIPVIGLLLDGWRAERAFSLPMRFILGLLVVLPLFNYFVTPFAMDRLGISAGGISAGGVEAAAPFSLQSLFESWQFSNPELAQWQTVVTINSILIAVAALMIAIRMIFSICMDQKIIDAAKTESA